MSAIDVDRLRDSMPLRVSGQHDLHTLSTIEDALKSKPDNRRDALALAELLLSNVHPATPRYFERLGAESRHSDLANYARIAKAAYGLIRPHFRVENVPEEQLRIFYDKDEVVFLKRDKNTKLLILLSTMFNNLFFSNAAMIAYLGQLDCSILMLKDPSLFNYLHGVKNFAQTMPEIGEGIVALAERNGLESIYICGFSSSGYAALYTALTIPCRGYIGFSHPIDLTPGSSLPPPKFFTPDVSEKVDQSMLFDLKPMLLAADPAIDRQFYFSEKDFRDAPQGYHLADVPTIDAVNLPDAGHNVILRMLIAGTLMPAFVRLLSG